MSWKFRNTEKNLNNFKTALNQRIVLQISLIKTKNYVLIRLINGIIKSCVNSMLSINVHAFTWCLCYVCIFVCVMLTEKNCLSHISWMICLLFSNWRCMYALNHSTSCNTVCMYHVYCYFSFLCLSSALCVTVILATLQR